MREPNGHLEIGVEAVTAETTVIRADGELDMATVGMLEEALEPVARDRGIVIDLTRCTFLDSSAVRVLVATSREVDEAGGSLALVACDPTILRVLEIAAVDTMVPVHATLAQAL